MTVASADNQGSSTRPYLLRALHDWCTDNGFTPYVAVYVDGTVQVPMEYVKNNEIVLNIGFEATSGLKLGNEWIEFRARFGGVPRDIVVPIDHVVAIYARENGQGMAFPVPSASGVEPPLASVAATPAPGGEGGPAAPAAVPAATRGGARTGLRLAARDGAEAAPSEAGDPAPGRSTGAEAPDPPPEPPAPPRPTLKRVK
jgi:stringent starvation protein B